MTISVQFEKDLNNQRKMCGGRDVYLRPDFLLDYLLRITLIFQSSSLYRQSSIFGLRLRPAWSTTWKGKSNPEIWHHGTRFSKCHHVIRFSKCHHGTRFSKCHYDTRFSKCLHVTRFSKCYHGTRFSKCHHGARLSKCHYGTIFSKLHHVTRFS